VPLTLNSTGVMMVFFLIRYKPIMAVVVRDNPVLDIALQALNPFTHLRNAYNLGDRAGAGVYSAYKYLFPNRGLNNRIKRDRKRLALDYDWRRAYANLDRGYATRQLQNAKKMASRRPTRMEQKMAMHAYTYHPRDIRSKRGYKGYKNYVSNHKRKGGPVQGMGYTRHRGKRKKYAKQKSFRARVEAIMCPMKRYTQLLKQNVTGVQVGKKWGAHIGNNTNDLLWSARDVETMFGLDPVLDKDENAKIRIPKCRVELRINSTTNFPFHMKCWWVRARRAEEIGAANLAVAITAGFVDSGLSTENTANDIRLELRDSKSFLKRFKILSSFRVDFSAGEEHIISKTFYNNRHFQFSENKTAEQEYNVGAIGLVYSILGSMSTEDGTSTELAFSTPTFQTIMIKKYEYCQLFNRHYEHDMEAQSFDTLTNPVQMGHGDYVEVTQKTLN